MRSLFDFFSQQDKGEMASKKGSILFIDDDPVILKVIGDRLTYEGYQVYPEMRSEDALDRLGSITPDLIILDISMPGLGGLGFLRRLGEIPTAAPCPVLVFSARHELEPFFTHTAVTAFVPKTCDPDVLVRQIRDLVAKHPRRTPGRKQGTILLVENERDYRDHLIRFFNRNGFDVHPLSEHISLLEAASTVNPHVILIKYLLPKHNGPQLAEQLGTYFPTRHIPVILYDDTGLHSELHPRPNVKTLVPSRHDEHLLKAIRQVFTPGLAPV